MIMTKKDLSKKIEEALDTIRPSLARDGGGVEYVSYDAATGTVALRFQGACVGCPMSNMTLKLGIEMELKEAIPEIKEVIQEV